MGRTGGMGGSERRSSQHPVPQRGRVFAAAAVGAVRVEARRRPRGGATASAAAVTTGGRRRAGRGARRGAPHAAARVVVLRNRRRHRVRAERLRHLRRRRRERRLHDGPLRRRSLLLLTSRTPRHPIGRRRTYAPGRVPSGRCGAGRGGSRVGARGAVGRGVRHNAAGSAAVKVRRLDGGGCEALLGVGGTGLPRHAFVHDLLVFLVVGGLVAAVGVGRRRTRVALVFDDVDAALLRLLPGVEVLKLTLDVALPLGDGVVLLGHDVVADLRLRQHQVQLLDASVEALAFVQLLLLHQELQVVGPLQVGGAQRDFVQLGVRLMDGGHQSVHAVVHLLQLRQDAVLQRFGA
eukprot:Rhum_TRINITY_DN3415_c0_g1::Rhum_TRINITY_DN3415_c0_g1_i1::g.10811::m.10811